jgi:thymidylate synthase (FAD)
MPRELARTVLPVATYSKMVVTASLLNWFRFLGLRCDEHAQYEIRVYADQIKELLRIAAPVSVVAFEAHWDPTIALKARIAELERLLRQANPEMGT